MRINDILEAAYLKHKANLICHNSSCALKGTLIKNGYNKTTGLRSVKCNKCTAQSSQLANIIFDSVGETLDFNGKDLTSKPRPQDDLNSALRSQVNNRQSEMDEKDALIQELLDSQKAQNLEIAKLNAQIAEQNKTIRSLSENISALTKSIGNAAPAKEPEPAAPAAPEGSVARREIPREPAGNADKEPHANKPPQAKPPAKTSWADIAKAKRPSVHTLSENEQNRFKETSKNLAALGFKPVPIQRRKPQAAGADPTAAATQDQAKEKPKPVPVYFGGVPRGPIGKLRAELRKCLPKWSILHVSFIGNSATEILCHEPLEDKLVGGMKLLGFRHMPNYDPLQEKNTDAATLRGRVNCYNRWRWGAESSYSEVSRQWFKDKMEALSKESPAVKEAADEKHSSNAEKNSAEKEAPKDPQPVPDAPAPTPGQPDETTEAQQRPEGEGGQ